MDLIVGCRQERLAVEGKTVSERAFEEYLSKRGLVARYEELPPGITRPVDYSVEIGGKTVRFDVKEWEPRDPPMGVVAFDPYKPIREKIQEGREKFKQYKARGEPCVLVLYHYGPQLITLDAMTIFGAMRGNIGWELPFDTQTAVADTSRTELTCLDGGGMVHHTPSGMVCLQNTTISAIAVLKLIDIRDRRIRVEFRKRKLDAGRSFTIDESFAVLEELYSHDKTVQIDHRVIVYDNLDAAVAVPAEFPSGPYDERFGRDGIGLTCIYVGSGLAAIEKDESSVGIKPDDPLGIKR